MTLRTTSLALICTVALLVMPAGCVKKVEDPNPKPNTSVTDETNLCEEVAEIACYNMFECCTGAEIESILGLTISTDPSACRRDVQLLCERGMSTLMWSVDRGATQFNPDDVEACISAIQVGDDGCFTHADEAPWYEACTGGVSWLGQVADGQRCYYDHECQEGAFCTDVFVCEALPVLDEDCRVDWPYCDEDFYCDWSARLCAARKTVSASCNSGGECERHLYCADGDPEDSCENRLADNEECLSNNSCESNFCVPGECQGNGNDCFEDSDCDSWMGECDGGGGNCWDAFDCGSGTCDATPNNQCWADWDCSGGATCVPDTECVRSCNGNPFCAPSYNIYSYCDALSYLPF